MQLIQNIGHLKVGGGARCEGGPGRTEGREKTPQPCRNIGNKNPNCDYVAKSVSHRLRARRQGSQHDCRDLQTSRRTRSPIHRGLHNDIVAEDGR